MDCPACGEHIPADNAFCASCGRSVSATSKGSGLQLWLDPYLLGLAAAIGAIVVVWTVLFFSHRGSETGVDTGVLTQAPTVRVEVARAASPTATAAPPSAACVVPQFVGTETAAATAAAAKLGLTVVRGTENSDSVPIGVVVRQQPAAGERLAPCSGELTLVSSSGPQPTPPPPPTPQGVSGQLFVVNSQPVGCHAQPSAEAAVVAQRPVGVVQTMDQVLRLPEAIWHRESTQQCWVRTQPGPVQLLSTPDEARRVAARYKPPLYQADWSNGTAGWTTGYGWSVLNGMLINNGVDADNRWGMATAPYRPRTIDFAVEAEFRVDGPGCGYSFGFVVRSPQPREGIWAGYYANCTNDVYISIDGIPETTGGQGVSSGRYKLDGGWHRLRIEVQGNAITFFVDDNIVSNGVNNRRLSSGSVGLWSWHTQVSVRNFRVTE